MSKKVSNEVLLLAEWSKRLGLHDWSIVLEANCHPSEMRVANSVGCTSWEESTKSAVIQIIDPEKIEPLTREFEFEEVLVHELLHIKMTLLASGEDDESLNDRVLHQIIDDLARAMVDVKKSERNKND